MRNKCRRQATGHATTAWSRVGAWVQRQLPRLWNIRQLLCLKTGSGRRPRHQPTRPTRVQSQWAGVRPFSLPPHIETCGSTKAEATATQLSPCKAPAIAIVWPASLARRSSWVSLPAEAGAATASVLQAGAAPGMAVVAGVPGCPRGKCSAKATRSHVWPTVGFQHEN